MQIMINKYCIGDAWVVPAFIALPVHRNSHPEVQIITSGGPQHILNVFELRVISFVGYGPASHNRKSRPYRKSDFCLPEIFWTCVFAKVPEQECLRHQILGPPWFSAFTCYNYLPIPCRFWTRFQKCHWRAEEMGKERKKGFARSCLWRKARNSFD